MSEIRPKVFGDLLDRVSEFFHAKARELVADGQREQFAMTFWTRVLDIAKDQLGLSPGQMPRSSDKNLQLVELFGHACYQVGRQDGRKDRNRKRDYSIGDFDELFIQILMENRSTADKKAILRIARQEQVSESTVRRCLNLKTRKNTMGRTREQIIRRGRLRRQLAQLSDEDHEKLLEELAQRIGSETVPVDSIFASD